MRTPNRLRSMGRRRRRARRLRACGANESRPSTCLRRRRPPLHRWSQMKSSAASLVSCEHWPKARVATCRPVSAHWPWNCSRSEYRRWFGREGGRRLSTGPAPCSARRARRRSPPPSCRTIRKNDNGTTPGSKQLPSSGAVLVRKQRERPCMTYPGRISRVARALATGQASISARSTPQVREGRKRSGP